MGFDFSRPDAAIDHAVAPKMGRIEGFDFTHGGAGIDGRVALQTSGTR